MSDFRVFARSSRVCRPRQVAFAARIAALFFAATATCAMMDGLQDILDEGKPDDLELLKNTCFTELHDWAGAGAPDKTNNWKELGFPEFVLFADTAKGGFLPLRVFVRPGEPIEPLSGWLAVPEAGNYRIWLGQLLEPGRKAPVLLRVSGATIAEHTFGETPPLRGEPGNCAEEKLPIRFETDEARSMPALRPMPVWEFWDVKLAEGATCFELTPESATVALESLALTRSLRFVPSKAIEFTNNTLTRAFTRYRVTPLEKDATLAPVRLKSSVVYNWAHHRLTSSQRFFYGSLGKILDAKGRDLLASGQWSAWLDITEEAVTGGGKYATDTLSILGSDGKPVGAPIRVEAQYAWFPHSGAVLNTIGATVTSGSMRYSFPATRLTYRAVKPGIGEASAAWGARDHDYAKAFRGEKELLEDLFGVLDGMNLESAIAPKHLVYYTSCSVAPEYLDLAVPKLQKLGINWLPIPMEAKKKFGLIPQIFTQNLAPLTASMGNSHDPNDPTFEKSVERHFAESFPPEERDKVTMLNMGDEIGSFSPRVIRYTADGRRAFQNYLASELEHLNTNAAFFGVSSLDKALYPLERPERPSAFERRLWYHAEDFRWRFTSDFYARYSRAAKKILPNLRTLANYTPGSFMHAGTMRSSNWFALPRHGGATMGWGEDWMGGIGRYAMAGIQSVSYYAAIIECACRKHRLPSGFILVASTGSIDRKMLSLAARGINFVYIYSWGPEYAGPVIDRFSNSTNCYPMIVRGIQALAPAEEILTQGRIEPKRAAVLYNLSNEYWHDAYAGMHFDRLLTFLALLHAHVPVDLVLEEDLNPETLANYKTVYAQGFNMRRSNITALADWVKAGGVLVGSSGAAMRDEYDDPLPEAEILFGAAQRLDAVSDGGFHPVDITEQKPIDTLVFSKSELTPDLSVPVVGVKLTIEPTTGQAVACYEDGSCGAVVNHVGKGKTLLMGIMPGHIYRHNAPRDQNGFPTQYAADRRNLIALPALVAGSRNSVDYSEPLVEITRFDHQTGIAVLMNDFSYSPGRKATLLVRTDRNITSVKASHAGSLEWTRKGDGIVIQAPVPDPVDVVVLQ